MFGIVFSLFLLAAAITTALTQPAGPYNDTADAPGYWIAATVLFGSIGITILVLSVRALLRTSDDD